MALQVVATTLVCWPYAPGAWHQCHASQRIKGKAYGHDRRSEVLQWGRQVAPIVRYLPQAVGNVRCAMGLPEVTRD